MSMAHDAAVDALKELLAELPLEFSAYNPETNPVNRGEFRVVKQSNCRKVHRALWELQVYFGLQE